MSADTWILAASAVVGPIIAVVIAFLFQRSLLNQQHKLQSAAIEKLQKLWLNWKAGDRNRFCELTNQLIKISDAVERMAPEQEETTNRFR